MNQLDILNQDLERLLVKWKNKKEVWHDKLHPDYLSFRCDKLKALWIRRQLSLLKEIDEKFAEKLFGQ